VSPPVTSPDDPDGLRGLVDEHGDGTDHPVDTGGEGAADAALHDDDGGDHRPEPLRQIEPCRQFVGERLRDGDADGTMQLGPIRPQAIEERPGQQGFHFFEGGGRWRCIDRDRLTRNSAIASSTRCRGFEQVGYRLLRKPLVQAGERCIVAAAVEAGERVAKHLASKATLEAVNAALDGYDEAMLLVWKQPHTRDIPLDAVGRVFALSFALEQLRDNARDLRDRAEELTHVR
jgi:hypothetical protein